MRRLLASGLALALCWSASSSAAQDIAWRPAGCTSEAKQPAQTSRSTDHRPPALRPIATTETNLPTGVTIKRPVPLDVTRPPSTSGAVTPAAFRGLSELPLPLVVRAKVDVPRPLPTGPELIGDAPSKSLTPPPPAPPSATSTDVSGDDVFRRGGKTNDARSSVAPILVDPGMAAGPTFFDGDSVVVGEGNDENGYNPWGPFTPRHSVLRLNMGYLLWFTKDANVPPLVTTSLAGTPLSSAGVIGAPGTRILLGGQDLDQSSLSGGKFTVALSLPRWPEWSFETTWFFLGQRLNDHGFGSGAFPILGRPITNLNTGDNDATLASFPGAFAGRIDVEDRVRLWGIEAYFRKMLFERSWIHLDWLVGYRHLQLEEGLRITEQHSGLAGAPAGQVNVGVLATDRFDTRNQFNGGMLGFETECRWRRWTFGTTYKLSLGSMHQAINVSGSQVFIPGTTTTTVGSGILALPSNSGEYSRSTFTVVPEVGLKVGVNITERLRLYVGYGIVYVGSVARPGDQIDTVVNRSLITVPGAPTVPTGAARPVVPFRTSDFWAQGANFGLEFRY